MEVATTGTVRGGVTTDLTTDGDGANFAGDVEVRLYNPSEYEQGNVRFYNPRDNGNEGVALGVRVQPQGFLSGDPQNNEITFRPGYYGCVRGGPLLLCAEGVVGIGGRRVLSVTPGERTPIYSEPEDCEPYVSKNPKGNPELPAPEGVEPVAPEDSCPESVVTGYAESEPVVESGYRPVLGLGGLLEAYLPVAERVDVGVSADIFWDGAAGFGYDDHRVSIGLQAGVRGYLPEWLGGGAVPAYRSADGPVIEPVEEEPAGPYIDGESEWMYMVDGWHRGADKKITSLREIYLEGSDTSNPQLTSIEFKNSDEAYVGWGSRPQPKLEAQGDNSGVAITFPEPAGGETPIGPGDQFRVTFTVGGEELTADVTVPSVELASVDGSRLAGDSRQLEVTVYNVSAGNLDNLEIGVGLEKIKKGGKGGGVEFVSVSRVADTEPYPGVVFQLKVPAATAKDVAGSITSFVGFDDSVVADGREIVVRKSVRNLSPDAPRAVMRFKGIDGGQKKQVEIVVNNVDMPDNPSDIKLKIRGMEVAVGGEQDGIKFVSAVAGTGGDSGKVVITCDIDAYLSADNIGELIHGILGFAGGYEEVSWKNIDIESERPRTFGGRITNAYDQPLTNGGMFVYEGRREAGETPCAVGVADDIGYAEVWLGSGCGTAGYTVRAEARDYLPHEYYVIESSRSVRRDLTLPSPVDMEDIKGKPASGIRITPIYERFSTADNGWVAKITWPGLFAGAGGDGVTVARGGELLVFPLGWKSWIYSREGVAFSREGGALVVYLKRDTNPRQIAEGIIALTGHPEADAQRIILKDRTRGGGRLPATARAKNE